jgi:hypothetical protein
MATMGAASLRKKFIDSSRWNGVGGVGRKEAQV